MIPKEISVINRVVGAQFHQCLLEFFSTDHTNQWVMQLRHEEKGNFMFLFDADNFHDFCMCLKQCIDTASDNPAYPNAKTLLNTVTQDMKTNVTDAGAITMISSWKDDPNVQLNFYSDQNDRKSRITLIYMLQDAMSLYNLFMNAYNNRERKQNNA